MPILFWFTVCTDSATWKERSVCTYASLETVKLFHWSLSWSAYCGLIL